MSLLTFKELRSTIKDLRENLARYERGWPPGHFYSPIPLSLIHI